MGLFDEHPYTAVTAIINRVIVNSDGTPSDGIIETELPELLVAIKLQKGSGSMEAARAIRKKLKHGSFEEQWKALNVLELLVANGDNSMRNLYNDEKLMERISYCINSSSKTMDVDPRIKKRCVQLAIGWKQEYDGSPDRQGLYNLYKSTHLEKLFNKKSGQGSVRKPKRRSVVPDFMNDEALTTPFDEEYGMGTETSSYNNDNSSYSTLGRDDESYAGSSSSRSFLPRVRHSSGNHSKNNSKSSLTSKTNKDLDRKYKIPKINLEKERPKIQKIISEGVTSAIVLTNTLTALDYKGGELSIHSTKANEEFDQCRLNRRKILRCLQLVSDDEELLGPLLHANDELVKALKSYEEYSVPSADNQNDDDDDDDSLAAYESDHGDDPDSDYDLESIVDSLATENPPSAPGRSNSVYSIDLRGHRPPPPPPPAKPNRLRAEKVHHRPPPEEEIDSDDPFNDGNQVDRPVQWR